MFYVKKGLFQRRIIGANRPISNLDTSLNFLNLLVFAGPSNFF